MEESSQLRETARRYRKSAETATSEARDWRLNLAEYLENLADAMEQEEQT